MAGYRLYPKAARARRYPRPRRRVAWTAPIHQTVAVSTAEETDTAGTVGAVFDQTIAVGTATETNTAQGVTVETVSGTRAQGGLAWLFRSGSAPVSQTISVGTAVETDTAGTVTQTVPGTVVIHPQGMVPGTAIGAYLRWEWRGPVAAKLNAGPGAVVQATTVSDDLTATFTLPVGEYVAYAEDYPTRRLFFMVTDSD